MAEKVDNDKARYTKAALFGIPPGIGLTRDEQILETQTAQLKELRDLKDRFARPGSSATTMQQYRYEPKIEVAAPEVHVDMGRVAEDLKPQFRSLIDGQTNLAQAVKGMGFQGQLTLRESRLHTGLLTTLDDHGKRAYDQRNAALALLAQSIIEGRGTNAGLAKLDEKAAIANKSLADIRSALGDTNESLVSIDHGVHTGNRLLSAVGGTLHRDLVGLGVQVGTLEDNLLTSLGELGSDIADLTDEVRRSSLQMVDAIQGFEDVFLWGHREKMALQRRILYAAQNPIGTQALEIWSFGEKARRTGNFDQAMELYRKSLELNPTCARNYFSLAMIALERGDALLAREFLNSARMYAEDEPELQALIMMYEAKIERFDGNNEKSLYVCEKAFETYKYNLEIWFELALLYIGKGETDRALYFIKNLLVAARRVSPGYVYKVLATPQFFPIIEEIRNILATV